MWLFCSNLDLSQCFCLSEAFLHLCAWETCRNTFMTAMRNQDFRISLRHGWSSPMLRLAGKWHLSPSFCTIHIPVCTITSSAWHRTLCQGLDSSAKTSEAFQKLEPIKHLNPFSKTFPAWAHGEEIRKSCHCKTTLRYSGLQTPSLHIFPLSGPRFMRQLSISRKASFFTKRLLFRASSCCCLLHNLWTILEIYTSTWNARSLILFLHQRTLLCHFRNSVLSLPSHLLSGGNYLLPVG